MEKRGIKEEEGENIFLWYTTIIHVVEMTNDEQCDDDNNAMPLTIRKADRTEMKYI